MTTVQERVTGEFEKRFGQSPAFVVRAPGRVNLIGEHTDYNDGFVMPLAIEGAIWIALRPSSEKRLTVHSLDFDQPADFSINGEMTKGDGWVEYLKGVTLMMQEDGYPLAGWEGVVGGDVPIGAGLSSSAALEMATARAYSAVSGFRWDAPAMAKLGQRAENKWVGVNCGIMDQMISAAGRAGSALLIDCRSLALDPVPLPPGTAVVILDTSTRRGLVGTAYNDRRSQCEAAAAHFKVKALRDVTVEQFGARGGELDEVTRRRARHVITENNRTLLAAEAMRSADADELGRLMDASHESLQHDFEVSNKELDVMSSCAREHQACYGARMTGAGFGGCAVVLIRAEAAGEFADSTAAAYREATGLDPKVYVTAATDGASVVSGS